MIPARELTLYVSVAAVLAFIISCATPRGARMVWSLNEDGLGDFRNNEHVFKSSKMPDFHHYQPTRILDEEEFPLDHPHRRVILIGDIHGMYKPFHQLLSKVHYNPTSDVLIHTGDFLAKGLHHHSMAVLDYMTTHNVTGVRGNHDQQILEWRGWINWICSTREGCQWLKRTEHHWRVFHGAENPNLKDDDIDTDELEEFIETQRKQAPRNDKRWWKLIPPDWKFLSGQYRIAREMKEEHLEYLRTLPLTLYVPSAHTFVVHAGILPSDPRFPFYDASRQPLAHLPDITSLVQEDSLCKGDHYQCTNQLRRLQELSILTDVPQNKRAWVLMNMRGVRKGKVLRKYRGPFWAKLWNRDMKRCVGYHNDYTTDPGSQNEESQGAGHDLPCYPSTVVYGHSASRGLSYKRWSIGLDTGCVYGRKLTALVIGGPRDAASATDDDDLVDVEHDLDVEDDEDRDRLLFGEDVDDDDESGNDGDEEGEDAEAYSDPKSQPDTNNRRRKKHKKNGDKVAFGDHYKAKIVSTSCR